MCIHVAGDGRPYTQVRGAEVNCPDPSAPPPAATKADTNEKAVDDDDDDDDAKADEKMKKMMKQGQELLDRQKRK
jgi:hypothetical protein